MRGNSSGYFPIYSDRRPSTVSPEAWLISGDHGSRTNMGLACGFRAKMTETEIASMDSTSCSMTCSRLGASSRVIHCLRAIEDGQPGQLRRDQLRRRWPAPSFPALAFRGPPASLHSASFLEARERRYWRAHSTDRSNCTFARPRRASARAPPGEVPLVGRTPLQRAGRISPLFGLPAWDLPATASIPPVRDPSQTPNPLWRENPSPR